MYLLTLMTQASSMENIKFLVSEKPEEGSKERAYLQIIIVTELTIFMCVCKTYLTNITFYDKVQLSALTVSTLNITSTTRQGPVVQYTLNDQGKVYLLLHAYDSSFLHGKQKVFGFI